MSKDMSSYEALYASESNPQIKKLILSKAKAGVSFKKFLTKYKLYKNATSPKFKSMYKRQMRAVA